MRRTATLFASLFLLAPAAAPAQQRPVNLQQLLRALVAAGDDPAALEKALEALDAQPLVSLASLHSTAAQEGAVAREAVRRRLPHLAWMGVMGGTLGEARRRETELLGKDAKRRLGDFASAVQDLLSRGDPPARLLALRLLRTALAPRPGEILPLLADKDPAVARAAAEALRRVARPEMKAGILDAFRSADPASAAALAPLAASVAGPEDAPALLELLKADPSRQRPVLEVVRSTADERAEPALLALLAEAGGRDPRPLLEALQLVGTAASIGPVRKLRDTLPAGDPGREACRQALLALRDPGLAAEIPAGREEVRSAAGDLARLGAVDAAPAIAERLRGRLKVEERNRLIELLGALGGPDAFDRIVPYLDDERHADAAALGLLLLGDPRAAVPLARALRTAGPRSAVARALLHLPPSAEGVEEPLLEILEDPQGHECVEDAFRVAARTGSPRLKARALAFVAESRVVSSRTSGALWDLLPSLGPADREFLLRAREKSKVRQGALLTLALAATGDPDALRGAIDDLLRRRHPLRHPRDPGRWIELPGLKDAMEEAFRTNPSWVEGAEWLAAHGSRTGAELLLDLARKPGPNRRALSAPALLHLGGPEAIEAYVSFSVNLAWGPVPDPHEESAARALGEDSVALLRERIALPTLNPAALRLLALRGDPVALAFFRSTLRPSRPGAAQSPHEQAAAAAFARAGERSLRPDFLRMLRSSSPRRRVLGARCLGLLGDRSAIHALAPLLDDRQIEINPSWHELDLAPIEPRVCDAAADAIEALLVRTFEAAPARRIEALKDWYAREGRDLK